MKIAIASDHAGFKLKELIKKTFADINFEDFGCFSEESA
ncbi:MAG TPA: RpiB/LacA/LacB family sugar-phosphate isomerase, partial [Spirochaetota bacterium]|nr:RpiB/LacA/LacB family sugar-phosphate isomerase [Spirochaetota bacterium]